MSLLSSNNNWYSLSWWEGNSKLLLIVKDNSFNITENDSWQTQPLNTKFLQIKANYSSVFPPYNVPETKTDWIDVTNGIYPELIIRQFNYDPFLNKTLVDVQIEVPSSEPPGNRSTTLMFSWRRS